MVFEFVVLHYLAEEMTLRCTETLLALPGPVRVVIVDNASPNGSGKRLQEHFSGHEAVTVLLHARNEGFARGNNTGYQFLREHFSCSFIAVINNDVLIPDRDFPAKVEAIYKETPFAVLGPDILNPDTGIHQNPAHLQAFTRKEVQERLDRYEKNLRHFRWNRFKWKLKQALRPAPRKPLPDFIDEPMENVVLHGACYVFSKDFINRRERCFNPDTFLYFEEDILHCECLQEGLVLRYDPSLQVEHLEDAATDRAFRTPARKEEMKLRESIRSMKVFLHVLKD